MYIMGIMRRRQPYRTGVAAGLLLWLLAGPALAEDGIRLLVDTDSRSLSVLQEGRVVERFEDIAIGRYGKTWFKRQGDNKTPLGRFTIRRITTDTRYHRFMGLDYPDLEAASRALEEGAISEDDWRAIRRASRAGKTPPQHSVLGGYIGIHGIGAGDPEIHEEYNWTNGCVALTNAQIDRLQRWVRIGTPVEIR
jgi:murein L,D-transpeptidase YafK